MSVEPGVSESQSNVQSCLLHVRQKSGGNGSGDLSGSLALCKAAMEVSAESSLPSRTASSELSPRGVGVGQKRRRDGAGNLGGSLIARRLHGDDGCLGSV